MFARIATFIWLGLALPAHADDKVRVLLNEDMRPFEFKSLSPVELSTGSEKIFLNHPRPELKIEFVRERGERGGIRDSLK